MADRRSSSPSAYTTNSSLGSHLDVLPVTHSFGGFYSPLGHHQLALADAARLYSSTQGGESEKKTSKAGQPSNTPSDTKGKTPVIAKELSKTVAIGVTAFDRAKVWLKNAPKHFMEELRHYWAGTKLLYYEVKICMGLLRKLTRGKNLTRRERRQLMRTTTDLLRLIPFAFFLVIPFMEFLLPVALKLFPNMLPSTFHDSMKQEESRKKQLTAKIEVAKFLQQAVSRRADAFITKHTDMETDVNEFVQRVSRGESLDNRSILKFSRLFEDEFTLDNLSRDQLVAMCKYMNLNTFGTTGFLRYLLSNKIAQLKKDDKLIMSEGIEALSVAELQAACNSRGLKSTSRSPIFLREQLAEWLELSLTHNLPTSLLILANAFKITSTVQPKDAIREALYHLPDKLVDEIRLKVAEVGVDNESLKLEVLKREAEMIKEEELEGEQTTKEVERQRLLEWIQGQQDIAQSSVTFSAAQLKAITSAVTKVAAHTSLDDETKLLRDLEKLLNLRRAEFKSKAEVVTEEIIEAYKEDSEMDLLREKEQLELQMAELMTEDNREQLSKQVATVLLKEELEDTREIKKLAKNLTKEKKFISKLDDKLESLLKDLQSEAQVVAGNVEEVIDLIDSDKDGVVSTEELEKATEMLNSTLPKDLVKHVIKSLDADRDGKILLADLRRMAKDEAAALHPLQQQVDLPEDEIDETPVKMAAAEELIAESK